MKKLKKIFILGGYIGLFSFGVMMVGEVEGSVSESPKEVKAKSSLEKLNTSKYLKIMMNDMKKAKR